MKKLVALMVALTMVLGLASVASAAEYPSKGISVICPWGAGGGTDAVLRAFCEAMGKDLGVTLTVDNRTGGGGIIGHQAIADAEPDGYTIGMITFELSTYKHLGTSELTYEDYEPLCRVNTDAAAITVNAEWPRPTTSPIWPASSTTARRIRARSRWRLFQRFLLHIAGGYLMNAADIELQMVTYQEGAATAVQNAASGFIQGVTVSLGEARNFIESGHLICLGVMDDQRNSLFPDVPTCKEQGYDIAYATQRGWAVPKGIDPAIKERLQAACSCRG